MTAPTAASRPRIMRRRRSIRWMTGSPDSSRVEYLPRSTQWVVLGTLTAFVVIGLALRRPLEAAISVPAAVVAVAGGWLSLRRNPPVRLICVGVATAGVVVIGNGMSSNVVWFAMCVLGAICALAGGWREALIFWVASLVIFAVEAIWVEPDPGWGAWIAGVTVTIAAALIVRHERDLVAQLRAAQSGLAERAKAEERNRIARELHDIIAHTLTVSLLHVTSARLAVEEAEPTDGTADAARALAEAERLGRETLGEVRAAVGLLRPDVPAGDGSASPLPTLDALPALVERFRQTGARIAITMHGETAHVPATVGLAVYRIAQEALTNAVKHAPGAPIALDLRIERGAASLRVESEGPPGSGMGLGMTSMRERAASVGGTCHAGPGGRGWVVRAELPIDVGASQQAVT